MNAFGYDRTWSHSDMYHSVHEVSFYLLHKALPEYFTRRHWGDVYRRYDTIVDPTRSQLLEDLYAE